MPDPDALTWIPYLKHRKATVSDWNISNAKTFSANGELVAQYNPLILGTDAQVCALEGECIRSGTLIKKSTNREQYFMECNQVVGTCSGEFTTYIYAEISTKGFHGRPISKDKLKQLGAKP